MTIELDSDAIDKITLDDECFGAAIEAATEAHVAGLEEQAQLEAGIKAYLWALGLKLKAASP